MGKLSEIKGKRVYLDANLFIYAFESLEPWKKTAQNALNMSGNGEFEGITGGITLLECLVGPMRKGDSANVGVYDAALRTGPDLEVVPITRDILVKAAELRAKDGLPFPDAIHLTTAIKSGCEVLLTNDHRLRSKSVQIVLLDELDDL